MINQLFLGFTLLGAQWVLWLLVLLSIGSLALIIERAVYFRAAAGVLERKVAEAKNTHLADAAVAEGRIAAEKRLAWLATIGANAPFIGLFGTVLGIIKAFHDLSQAGTQGSNIVSAGISEALVATAIGIFVAIPAMVSYNIFQRKVKDMLLRAEAARARALGEGR